MQKFLKLFGISVVLVNLNAETSAIPCLGFTKILGNLRAVFSIQLTPHLPVDGEYETPEVKPLPGSESSPMISFLSTAINGQQRTVIKVENLPKNPRIVFHQPNSTPDYDLVLENFDGKWRPLNSNIPSFALAIENFRRAFLENGEAVYEEKAVIKGGPLGDAESVQQYRFRIETIKIEVRLVETTTAGGRTYTEGPYNFVLRRR